MKITIAEVEHVARLARLELAEEEINLFAGQMDAILEYVEKLKELNTEGIVPIAHVEVLMGSVFPFREDAVQSPIGLDRALSNAPKPAGSFFAVPKVIE
ncbi:MAG: Asp-tRNA(Asn)/Glu-tRNA(Gln) amidotransferase subunit GatC [Desulfuromonadaceae bacterium]|nr:Asp-tRNA(Asn)/Glu-tRNA(Gln) amidotransferase subunit GatC [Desulfuromonadaceae bacterium]